MFPSHDRGGDFEYEPTTYDVWVPLAQRKVVCLDCDGTKMKQCQQYTPDIVLKNTGIVVEIKGRLTAANRRKYAAFVDQYPHLDFRMLLQKDSPISKGSKTKYTDWCDKVGIPYYVGESIPDEWCESG